MEDTSKPFIITLRPIDGETGHIGRREQAELPSAEDVATKMVRLEPDDGWRIFVEDDVDYVCIEGLADAPEVAQDVAADVSRPRSPIMPA